MYEKLKKKILKEKRKEIARIELWEELAKPHRRIRLEGLTELERLTRVALAEQLPIPSDCEWYKLVCHHPKSKRGTCLLEAYRDDKRIRSLPSLEKVCPFFEPNYNLRVIGGRGAQKEILKKLAAQHFFILGGGWAKEIILGIPHYHRDIDILVIEKQWKEFRDFLEKEGFEIETKRGKISARKGLVIIDIALITEEEHHYIMDVYINDSFWGQLRFPKDGFEKQGSFLVMCLELQWLSLGPERRTRKAKKLAKFLNHQRIKELDAKFSFEAAGP